MTVAIITGSSGLIGSEAVKFFNEKGYDVVGIDNNMRQYFFGEGGSTRWNTKELERLCPRFTPHDMDVRDEAAIDKLFKKYGGQTRVVIHAAAQPSHDWAAREPFTDFSINATGTLVILEAVRRHCPEAVFIYTSTNKVYGDTPNFLPLDEKTLRWEIKENHPYFQYGIDETMTVDQSKHSLFGVSKLAADAMVQEYGRYFGLKTGVFRGGCLTGPAHSGVELHGFLAYLVLCAVTRKAYTVYGYKGKQVRDNIHSHDLVNAFWHFAQKPRSGAVYNMGGSRHSNCSILEAVQKIEKLIGREVPLSISGDARSGDHIWWISDVRRFKTDFPDWQFEYDLDRILGEIIEATKERHPKITS